MKNRVGLVLALSLVVAWANRARADYSYSYTVIDHPAAVQTWVSGINDRNQMVGTFQDGAGRHGFHFDGLQTFTTLDHPGGTSTWAEDVNGAGLVVGTYEDRFRQKHGFIFDGTAYQQLDFPAGSHTYTWAAGANDAGQVVGYYQSGPDGTYTYFYGYLYEGGSYTTIRYPGSLYTWALGINDSGHIVGYYQETVAQGGARRGFLYRDGAYTPLDFPGAHTTQAHAINDDGHVVGVYKTGLSFQGFLYDGTTYAAMDHPDGSYSDTWPADISGPGRAVGYLYGPDALVHGFINCPSPTNPGHADTDGDGLSNVCDNCPAVFNPLQVDGDVDGAGDGCDNCPGLANPEQADEDADGVGALCDNCPDTPNPGQDDNDADGSGDACDNCPSDENAAQDDGDLDGIGDVCDNCPSVANEAQSDGDADGAGDDCDNCLGLANPGQEDFDRDGQGDDCDCEDGYWGPGEDGADCGGTCAEPCTARCVPIIQYGDTDGKIDVVMIPSQEYAAVGGPALGVTALQEIGGLLTPVPLPAQWRADVVRLIQDSYYADPLINAFGNIHKINFWYVRRYADFTTGIYADCGDRCERSAPRGWEEDCPAGSIAAVIHIECCRDSSRANVFSAENTSIGTFLHESGHGVFDLVDEYDDEPNGCRTNYFTLAPYPNIFLTEFACRNDATWPTDCFQFTDCFPGWWKAQPDTTIMNGCSGMAAPGYPNVVCPWGMDAEPQVQYVLDLYEDPPASPTRKAVVAELRYDGASVSPLSVNIVYGDAPERVLEFDALRVVSRNQLDQSVGEFTLRDPRYVHYDYPTGAELLEEADFHLVLPFLDNLKTVEIRAAESGELLGVVDIAQDVLLFCLGYPDDPDCMSYDPDADAVPGAVDNCPTVANPDQADRDGDGIGDVCDSQPDVPNPRDDDADGVPDEEDNCPTLPNPLQIDTDGDGAGDACDDDVDGDGVADEADLCPMQSGLAPSGCPCHSCDYSPADWSIGLSELLRAIQFYNVGEYSCDPEGEDGYAPGAGDRTCTPHASDYNPQDWSLNLSELLRAIQFYNSGGYHPSTTGEDGFAPGP